MPLRFIWYLFILMRLGKEGQIEWHDDLGWFYWMVSFFGWEILVLLFVNFMVKVLKMKGHVAEHRLSITRVLGSALILQGFCCSRIQPIKDCHVDGYALISLDRWWDKSKRVSAVRWKLTMDVRTRGIGFMMLDLIEKLNPKSVWT